MTERKFTDEQIIEALAHCTSSTTSEACNGCPFSHSNICEQMSNGLEIYALDLINRQRAEIERLKKYYFTHDYHECHNEAIKEFAERLKEELRLSTGNNGGFVPSMIDNLVKEMTEGK